jgi:hypothetical protein
MWAPESFANDAIDYYKSLLRKALEDLMETSATLRSRTKSIQSDRLSLDSDEDERHIYIVEGYGDVPTEGLFDWNLDSKKDTPSPSVLASS